MSCKYKYNNTWYSKEELKSILLKERSILPDGKLVKPEIKKEIKNLTYTALGEYNQDRKNSIIKEFKTKDEAVKWIEENKEEYENQTGSDLILGEFWEEGKQPTQTRENITSIESVKKEVMSKVDYNYTQKREELTNYNYNIGQQLDKKGYRDKYGNKINNPDFTKEELQEQENLFKLYEEGVKKLDDYRKNFKPEKEYTSQALTNLKIAALKEVARKYPRSLITSKVVPINPNMVDNSEIQYSKIGSKQDIEGFKQFLKKDDESIYYKNLEDEIKVLEEDKIKIAEKRRNFREWINRFTTLNEVKNDNQKLLESRRQVFKSLGFTETYDNTFELKTSSYVTLISKKQALDDNPLIRFDGKLTGVKYTQKSVDGTYILTYKLDDITKTSIREAQIKGEMPFTKSDLKETLKSEDFLNSVSENIFDGLSPEETQIIKEKLESGEYNINCKL